MLNYLFYFSVFFSVAISTYAQIPVDLSLGFSSSKEQAKNDSTGQSGGALFKNSQISFQTTGTYPFHENFEAGLWMQYEKGSRGMCGFGGVTTGTPQVTNCQDGQFSQFFVGPLLRAKYSHFFLDVGYAAFGVRSDDAYSNLTAAGQSSQTFHTHPLKAWIFYPGFSYAINESISVILKIEYRYLYFKKRGNADLPNDLVYGNQNIRPLLGLQWKL